MMITMNEVPLLARFMAGGNVLTHGDFDAQCLIISTFVTKNSVLLQPCS